ncbi:MAG TPA: DoxX family protein [Verrucomicrobiae bacterium]|nr:DoxX family protein [Verrucomicrobiae bacterium]
MIERPSSAAGLAAENLRQTLGGFRWSQFATIYGRLALGAAFLSGIADRFGLYRGRNVGYGNFEGFVRYTAQVNSFMPASTIPFLAWAATAAEFSLGVLLIAGIWRRPVAIASAILLVLFGTAMAISFGIKSPLDYSVFSASSAAVLLAVYSPPKRKSSALENKPVQNWDVI